MNELILGDNLDILSKWPAESVDLIYLDPPFFTNQTYEVIWGDKGEVRSFEDRFSGGINVYIDWLKKRVSYMHRVLKPTGSIFLHCDWHANAYIRVEILDKIFGINNFINEIIWCYLGPGSPGVKQFLRKHDTIYWYAKSDKWIFNVDDVRFVHSEKTRQNYKSGLIGSGFDGAPRLINQKGKVPEDWWADVIPNRIINDFVNSLHQNSNLDDWFDDIAIAARYPKNSDNNIGYPTQKPNSLIERLIKAASNKGDIVMDPFVGGGTTITVADRLGRKWVGIDQSVQAIKVTDFRLQRLQSKEAGASAIDYSDPYILRLHKYDYDTLRYQNAFDFEQWIVQQYGGIINIKQRNDKGIDGRTRDNVPIQVKRSDNVGSPTIRQFLTDARNFDKSTFDSRTKSGELVGIIIAFSFGKGAREEVAQFKNSDGGIIKLVEVETIVPIAKKPVLTLKAADAGTDSKGNREISFTASGSSEAGIEFYAWQWAYDESKGFRPDVLIDKDGQQTHAFKPGMHSIACKVVDNDGLEALEVLRLKVNGGFTVG